MIKCVLAFIVLSTTQALAQERSYTITLPGPQWDYVSRVLGKQPYEESAKIIHEMFRQVQLQEKQARDLEMEQLKKELGDQK